MVTGQTGIFGTVDDLVAGIIGDVLKDRLQCPHVLVGPVVWREARGNRREWYFVLASGDGSGFFSVQVNCGGDASIADQVRAAAQLALLRRPPIVVHDMGDELAQARLCGALWPGTKTRQIRAGIEAERSRWASTR